MHSWMNQDQPFATDEEYNAADAPETCASGPYEIERVEGGWQITQGCAVLARHIPDEPTARDLLAYLRGDVTLARAA